MWTPTAAAVSALLGDAAPERCWPRWSRAGVAGARFAVDAPGLEDVFVALTGEGFDVSG